MHASKHGHAEMVVLSRFNADVDTSGDWVDSDDSDYDSELYYFDPFHGFHGNAAFLCTLQGQVMSAKRNC